MSTTKSLVSDGWYNPLDESRDEIRLLSLQFCKGKIINTQIAASSLHENPQYQALSYEWSLAITDRSEGFVLPGPAGRCDLQLTPNLSSFLYHFGLPFDEPTWTEMPFWIDSVCINQLDLKERASQVRLMPQIYRSAFRTIIWLGPRLGCSDSGLRSLGACIEARTDLLDAEQKEKVLNNFFREQSLRPRDSSGFIAALELLERSYWKRGWIIQEIALSDVTSVVICGNAVMSSPGLFLILHMLERAQFASPESLSGTNKVHRWLKDLLSRLSNVHRPNFVRENQRIASFQNHARLLLFSNPSCAKIARIRSLLRSEQLELRTLLMHLRFCQTTDPRDRIYSLLGLVRPYSGTRFVIDYTVPWQEVFRRTVIYIIQGTEDLSVLACCGSGGEELPSWVPDWNDPVMDRDTRRTNAQHWSFTENTNGELHCVSGDWSAGGKAVSLHRVSFSEQVLQLPAIFIGTIDEILPPANETMNSDLFLALSSRVEFLISDRRQASLNTVVSLCIFIAQEIFWSVISTAPGLYYDPDAVYPIQSVWVLVWLKAFQTARGCLLDLPNPAKSRDYGRHFDLMVRWINLGLLTHRTLFKLRLASQVRTIQEAQAGIEGGLRFQRSLPKRFRSKLLREAQRTLHEELPFLPWSQTFGVCRVAARAGDSIVVLPGCSFPLILRPAGDSRACYRIVGAAWVSGLMKGEALGKLPEALISII